MRWKFMTGMQEAYNTSKRKGIVAANAVVPRIVADLVTWPSWPAATILDFGAGKHSTHTLLMREKGLHVTAYEQPEFADGVVHDVNALKRRYDIVFASNVLNVLPNRNAVVKTLKQMSKAVAPGGAVILNYPASPRKWTTKKHPKGVPSSTMARLIENVFDVKPILIHGTNSVPVWLLRD